MAPESVETQSEVDDNEYMVVSVDIESGRQLKNPIDRMDLPNALV